MSNEVEIFDLPGQGVGRPGAQSPLQILRLKAGMTGDEFAEAINRTRQTISNWEVGLKAPILSPLEWVQIAWLLHVDIKVLAVAAEATMRGLWAEQWYLLKISHGRFGHFTDESLKQYREYTPRIKING